VKQMTNTQERILQQLNRYPEMEIQDVFKFLYQSCYGCEHLVSDRERVNKHIREESAVERMVKDEPVTPLDGAFSRVDLCWIDQGLSPETMGKLFCLSAGSCVGGKTALEEKLAAVTALVCEGSTPYQTEDFRKEVQKWREAEYPAVRHSEKFRSMYFPAYRVIANRYIPYLPLLAKIDSALSNGSVKVAVEGGSASGKTTLGELLENLYDCTLFHMDDFFLRPEQRTPERFGQPGGNVDRERFLEEVLLPLSREEPVIYRTFDCGTFTLSEPKTVEPGRVTVIEGAYSMHPELADFYDFAVFLDVEPELQRVRIEKRNGAGLAKRFFQEWIPMEEMYFREMNVKDRCDLVIPIGINE